MVLQTKNTINRDSYNLIWIMNAICMSVFIYLYRIGFETLMTLFDYLFLVSVTIIIISFPDELSKFLESKIKGWACSPGFIMLASLLSFSFIGLAVEETVWLEYPIIALASWLLYIELKQVRSIKQVGILILGTAMVFFTMLQMFNGDYIDPLYFEKSILGLLHRDTVFHSSIGSIISTTGIPSTGLHGIPSINYHWGSHYLFAGYINLFSVNALLFYNLIYPVLISSIFAKAAFIFLESFERLTNLDGNLWISPIVTLLIFTFYATSDNFSGFPFGSQSTIIAIVFIWVHLAIIFEYKMELVPIPSPFILFSAILILIVFFLKISSGLIYAVGIIYVYLRLEPQVKTLVYLSALLICILGVLFFIFPSERILIEEFPQSIIGLYLDFSAKIETFWGSLMGVMVALIGFFAWIFMVLKNESVHSFNSFVELFRTKKYLSLEALALMNLAAVLVGLYLVFTSGGKSVDVYYFISTVVFISLALFVYPLKKLILNFKAPASLILGTIILFIILMFISKPMIARFVIDRYSTKQELRGIDDSQLQLKQLMQALELLRQENNTSKRAVYIPLDQTWYYNSQTFRDIAAPFIVPAISGIPMIGGIPEFVIDSGRQSYGFYLYQNRAEFPILDDKEAIKMAEEMLIEELIIFRGINGKLSQHRLKL